MKLRLNITPKLTLVFVLFAALLLAGIGAVIYYSGRATLEKMTLSELLARATEKEGALNDWFIEKKGDINRLARAPHLLAEMTSLTAAVPNSSAAQATHERLVKYLQAEVELGDYLRLSILHPKSGQIIVSTDAAQEGKYREDHPFFRQGRAGPYIQSEYASFVLEAPVVIAAAPLRSLEGELLGVLAGSLDLSDINTIMQRRTGRHKTFDTFLLNEVHLMVTQPYLLNDPAVLRRGVFTPAANRCLAGESSSLSAPDYRGLPALIVYRWLAPRQLCLIVKVDQAEALAPIDAFGRILLLGGGVVLAVASVLAIGLARTITRPILALQAGVARFSQGKLDWRLPETSRDELGLLAHEFNLMAATLTEKETQLRQYTNQLEQMVAERTAALMEKIAEQVQAQKELEHYAAELQRSNQELEQFAYIASHDLREPLRSISGYLQLLERRYRGQLDAEADKFIARSVAATERMGTLISDLLAYSRVGTRGREFEAVDCKIVLDQVVANLAQSIKETEATVSYDQLPTIEADPGQFVQLFQNLVGNAIKFHKDESPRVYIGAEQSNGDWLFSVKDNGMGMEAQYTDRIFLVFQRLQSRTNYPGNGIGLAICKKIVERHQGRIWVETEPGQGSTFFFTIPHRKENIYEKCSVKQAISSFDD